MRFMCLLADGETVETTLDFAMGQVWNWHASVFEQDYMNVRSGSLSQTRYTARGGRKTEIGSCGRWCRRTNRGG